MLLFFSTVEEPDDELNRTQCISKWPDAIGFDSKLEYGYVVILVCFDSILDKKILEKLALIWYNTFQVQCNLHDHDLLSPNDVYVLHIFKNWSGTLGK